MAMRLQDVPVYDADNHLDETRESLTKFLLECHGEVISDESARRTMGGNLARWMGVDDAVLRT